MARIPPARRHIERSHDIVAPEYNSMRETFLKSGNPGFIPATVSLEKSRRKIARDLPEIEWAKAINKKSRKKR